MIPSIQTAYNRQVRWTVEMEDGSKCEAIASSKFRAKKIAEIMNTGKAKDATFDGEI